jgi:enoyl-CoA hydratase
MVDDCVLYSEEDGVGVVTLNRPAVRNALNHQMYLELESVVRASAARCLVITGAGDAFCSGDDLRDLRQIDPAARARRTPALTPAADALLFTNVPLIAAVNGPAAGWGMELALLADIRIASSRARFSELFVTRGLCSDVAGIGRLAQLVGRELAARLLLTGEWLDADRAASAGLVSGVFPPGDLMPEALSLARSIAAHSTEALAAIKQGLRRALDPDWADLGRWTSVTLGSLVTSSALRTSVDAFLDDRQSSD